MKSLLTPLIGLCALTLTTACTAPTTTQTAEPAEPWSLRLARSEMKRCPEAWQLDFQSRLKWDYCHGLELRAMLDLYDRFGGDDIYQYALAYADTMVNDDGTIKTYNREEFSIDRINSGKLFFRIYEQSKDEKYERALALLRSQLDEHPRNDDGGFWHKKVYPHQVWLDGVYMGTPFLAEYAYRHNQVADYEDVIRQIVVAARHTYDPATGLYRHACDVSRTERWADPETGQSAHTWGRALGWYAMAIVDALDYVPTQEAGRDTVLTIFGNIAAQLERYQDATTGLWYQVMDRSGDEGNYTEATCSCMFVYALLKGVRCGYIDSRYLAVAERGYQGIVGELLSVDDDGLVSINRCCAVAGLGGKNYRSGDYDYYIHETIRANDPKAIGPFILADLERMRLIDAKAKLANN